MNIYYSDIINELRNHKVRSAWKQGIIAYAIELAEQLKEAAEYNGRNPESFKELNDWLLNGADNWKQYSYGGNALIYNRDIAERLCTHSELKRTHNGEKNPNAYETWLDVQTRALKQASFLVKDLYYEHCENL